MCPAAATGTALFAVGVMLCPFPALVPSCRNLTAVLPEIWGLLAAIYFHLRDELSQLLLHSSAITTPSRRRSPRYDD